MRGDAAGRLCRTPADPPFQIVSQVWRVGGRDIVMVGTGSGSQVLSFYRRTGLGNKGVGAAVVPGNWAPFKTLMEHPKSPGKPWFNKNPYYTTIGTLDESAGYGALRGYGNTRNAAVGQWLDTQALPPAAEAASWEAVEQEMDQAAAAYRARISGGGPGGGAAPAGVGGAVEGEGAGTGSRTVDAEGKAVGAEARVVGQDGKAVGAEAKVLAGEAKALQGEGAAIEIAVDAAKAGRAAAIGALLLELGLPGPWDVFFMFLSAFASIAEARAKLRADAFALGFAEGLSAALTGTSASDATRLLMFKAVSATVSERVGGVEGVREVGTNDGVAAGFRFGAALNSSQRTGFLGKGFAGVKSRNHTISGDFGRDDLIELAVALRPTVLELLEEAQRQEEARLARERRERKDWVGNKV